MSAFSSIFQKITGGGGDDAKQKAKPVSSSSQPPRQPPPPQQQQQRMHPQQAIVEVSDKAKRGWDEIQVHLEVVLRKIRNRNDLTKSNATTGVSCKSKLEWYTLVHNSGADSQQSMLYLDKKLREFVRNDLLQNVRRPLQNLYASLYRDRGSSGSQASLQTADIATAAVAVNTGAGGASNNNTALLIFEAITRHYQEFCLFRQLCQLIFSGGAAISQRAPIASVMNALFHEIVYSTSKELLCAVIVEQVNWLRKGHSVNMLSLLDGVRMFGELANIMPSQSAPDEARNPAAVAPAANTSSAAAGGAGVRDHRYARLREDFVDRYIEETKKFYDTASRQKRRETGGAETYLRWVTERFDLEMKIVRDLLPIGFAMDIRLQLEQVLVNQHLVAIVQNEAAGFRALVTSERWDELKRMFHLLVVAAQSVAPADKLSSTGTTEPTPQLVAKPGGVPPSPGLLLMCREMVALTDSKAEEIVVEFAREMRPANTETQTKAPASQPAQPLQQQPVDSNRAENAFVSQLVALWNRQMGLVAAHLNGDAHMKDAVARALRQQFAAYSKERTSLPPLGEVLATYMDQFCRQEGSVGDEAADVAAMDSVVALVLLIPDRDVFLESFRAKLAKRLLTTRPNMEQERLFIQRLQQPLGKVFTLKLEAMVRDYEATGELNREFAAHRAANAGGDGGAAAEMVVQVLTASHWPSYRADNLTPPRSLEGGMRSFRHFYSRKHVGRSLSWVHMLGTSQIHVGFPSGAKEVECNLFQGCILALLGDEPRQCATVGEIAARLGLPLALVKPQLASMYLHKVYCLLSLCDSDGNLCPAGRAIGDGDRLTLNRRFAHKSRKFKLAAPAGAKKEGEPGQPEIEAMRRMQADAAIVRVMKSRRTLGFNDLLEQVVQQVSRLFVPQPAFVKQRVEDLIGREYLRRDPNDRNLFEYVA